MIDSTYSGVVDKFHLRIGEGVQRFRTHEGTEIYNGPFIHNAYHGYGQYITTNVFGESWTYEGMFYVNNFHGYGTLSYADGSIFSGLYKMGKQFGPGILTYPDGKQDVGLWVGSQLMRLSVAIPGVEELCTFSKNRIQASIFKKLVQVPNEKYDKDLAKDIFKEITSDEELLAESDKLYSRHCKNPQSILFDKKLYKDYSNYHFTDMMNVMDIILDANSDNTESSYYANINNIRLNENEGNVVDKEEFEEGDLIEEDSIESSEESEAPVLLSWNNQDIIIELMLHSFKYRHQECIPNYDVGDILCYRRQFFGQNGEKEQSCIEMLLASFNNDPKTILRLLTKLHLNPDVMDNKGNSMILLAAANNSEKVIQVLGELEVNMNSVNDEGFNALNHTLTRYLALMFNVTDWGVGFMPTQKYIPPEILPKEWILSTLGSPKIYSRRSRSRQTLNRRSTRSFIKKKGGLKLEPQKKYIFDLSPLPPNVDTNRDQQKGISLYKKSIILEDEQQNEPNQGMAFTLGPKTEKMNKMKKIERTFQLLLETGVNVNGSMTPAPLLTLAIFTLNESIIENVLKYKADPNSRLEIEPGNLTPLHVMVLMKPRKTSATIVELLIEYGADPHLRTDIKYRQEYWEFLLSYGRDESFSSNSDGMTPLHALILRPDADYLPKNEYLLDICCLLAWHTGQDLFHGLTPLGLAIAYNSFNFMTVLLVCSEININEKFDDFWGNYLTTFMMIHGASTDPTCLKMFKHLLKNGADPLCKMFSKDENIMNFVQKYRNKMLNKKHKPANSYLSVSEYDKKENILRKIAKERVEDHIKGVLIRSLLYCMQMTIQEDPLVAEILQKILKRLGEWVGHDEFLQILSMNLKNSEFSDDMQLVNALIAFINFTELFQNERLHIDHVNAFLEKITKMEMPSSEVEPNIPNFTSKMASEIKQMVTSSKVRQLVPAALDRDGDLYRVCYECMRWSKNLQLCLECELVYFCSIECKIKSYADSRSKHKCRKVTKTSEKRDLHHKKGKRGIVSVGSSAKLELTESKLETTRKTAESERAKSKKSADDIDKLEEKSDLRKKTESIENKSFKTPKKSDVARSKKLEKSIRNKQLKRIKSIAKKVNKNVKRFKLNIKHDKKGLKMKFGRNIKKFSTNSKSFNKRLSKMLIDLKVSEYSKKTNKLLKKVKSVGWRDSLFSIFDYVKWDSSTSSTSDPNTNYLRKLNKFLKFKGYQEWPHIGTICPPVVYSVLGGKARVEGLCEQHDSMYKFSLADRLKAYFLGIYEVLGTLMNKGSPFILFIPQHGKVLYKDYPENFENYSFN